jgi:hypothetical protein
LENPLPLARRKDRVDLLCRGVDVGIRRQNEVADLCRQGPTMDGRQRGDNLRPQLVVELAFGLVKLLAHLMHLLALSIRGLLRGVGILGKRRSRN